LKCQKCPQHSAPLTTTPWMEIALMEEGN